MGPTRVLRLSTSSFEKIRFLGSSPYNTFQDYLENLGCPAFSRNVALVSGADDGELLSGVNAGSKFIDYELSYLVGKIVFEAWHSIPNQSQQLVSKLHEKQKEI